MATNSFVSSMGRETKESELLERASNDVFRYFSDGRSFRAQSLFIATWHQVSPNELQTTLVSGFPIGEFL